MRGNALIAKCGRCRRYSSYRGGISEAPGNLLKRNFFTDAPNEKWLTDTTKFKIPAGKVYLSFIVERFDGMVISWVMSTSPDAELANSSLDAAIKTLGSDEHSISHSDRRCHYRWPGWIKRCNANGTRRSLSKKGSSPDNSACEGLLKRMKVEMFFGRSWVGWSIGNFMDILDCYIHWYNEQRIRVS